MGKNVGVNIGQMLKISSNFASSYFLFTKWVELNNMSDNAKINYLKGITTPADLKQVPREDLAQVCDELREFIINELSGNPGHLGSNLGTVELSVALHYVFDTPYDRIVWDVGHQAYGHKILTGRREVFHTNRKFKGLSGFPSMKESEYDSFGVGHSSTSISAALGMSVASVLKGEEDRQSIAVIGDGAMTGGLAFEGINNADMTRNNMLIVLNDNNMAIDPLRGGMTQYLVDINTSHTYNKWRYKAYLMLRKLNLINDSGKNRVLNFNNNLKTFLTKQQRNIFNGMNIRYFGPVDGHDVEVLVRVMSELKKIKGPKVLHIITKKGKGYAPAERDATVWHAPGEFDVATGKRCVGCKEGVPPLFQDVFGETLLELARMNESVVGITPAMPSGCSMCIMQREMPDRVFDVGIAEGHAVTFSAGLAREGVVPFCNIYSSFMQRAYDNVIHDVALQKLPVIMCLDRAGIVGADGATHHGLFDLAYLRCIPDLTIAAPLDEVELRNMMYTAQLSPEIGAWAIRYPRGRGVVVDWRREFEAMPVGKGRCLREGEDVAVVTLGAIGSVAMRAIERVVSEKGASVAHYDMRFLKPMDEEMLHEIGARYAKVMTVEDGVLNGGLGSAVVEFMSDHGYAPRVTRLGVKDTFVEHGSIDELYAMLGLDVAGIAVTLAEMLEA